MATVLWTAMVFENDLQHLDQYLNSVLKSTVKPDKILIIDSGHSKDIENVIRHKGLNYISLGEDKISNEGFNPSFNYAAKYAINNDYDYLVTMSVRCIPKNNWLERIINTIQFDKSAGMATSLHLSKDSDRIHNLGHFLSPSGGLYDFARNIKVEHLQTIIDILKHNSFENIWSPCSGGALYVTAALKNSTKWLKPDYEIFSRYGFKSNNCGILGFIFRVFGYKNIIVYDAECIRDESASTSRYPNSAGLLINQEINRISNIYTYWPEDIQLQALSNYIAEKRIKPDLREIDKRIILTLAKNLVRSWNFKDKIKINLQKHLDRFEENITLRKQLN